MTLPLCPVVLAILAVQPRHPHEIASALDHRGFPAATITLARLADSGLVRRRARDGRFLVTRRGRRELGLHRAVCRAATAPRG